MRGAEFAELKAFAAIVERASFARAAEQLGLSPSALSQTLRQLETRLGVRLLNRTTRSVAPTTAGARLYERIVPMILELDAAVLEAVASTGRIAGTLRINTLGMAAQKVISTRLGRFHRAHPDVVLDIVVDDSLSDIVAGRFDAGIRVGRRLEKDMTVIRLTPDWSRDEIPYGGRATSEGAHNREISGKNKVPALRWYGIDVVRQRRIMRRDAHLHRDEAIHSSGRRESI